MVARFAAAALVAAAVVVFVIVFRGDSGHELRASFDAAVQVVPGQEVRIAGRQVGSIRNVDEADGTAVVTIGIADDQDWPLTRGTTARLRWGSTSGYALRYIELAPGPANAPELEDGGLLPRLETTTPVELDDMYRVFRGSGREELGELVGELGVTFGPRAEGLARTLQEGPGGLDQLAETLNALGSDEAALHTLIVSGDRTATALAQRDGELGEVVGHAAQTFDEMANRAGAIQASLDRLSPTLADSTSTLARLDTSVVGLQDLVGKLQPGTTALRRMAPAARGALSELRAVAPLASTTLRSGTAAAPAINRLLETGTDFMPGLDSALGELAPMLSCIRPYTPEFTGFLSTWTGFTKNYDSQGHYGRILVEAPPAPVGTTDNSAKIAGDSQGRVQYAMPRPPGLNAGQPFFQPQCGAGPDALDASKDPEGAGAGR